MQGEMSKNQQVISETLLQGKPDEKGQENLVSNTPVPPIGKPKVMTATEPGTEYWLP